MKQVPNRYIETNNNNVNYILVPAKKVIFSNDWKAYDIYNTNDYLDDDENDYAEDCEMEDFNKLNKDSGLTKNKNVIKKGAKNDQKEITDCIIIVNALLYDYGMNPIYIAKLTVSKCNQEKVLTVAVNNYRIKCGYNRWCSLLTKSEHNNILFPKDKVRSMFFKAVKKSSILVGENIVKPLESLQLNYPNVLDFSSEEIDEITNKKVTTEYWRKFVKNRLEKCENHDEYDQAHYKEVATIKLIEYYLNQQCCSQKEKLREVYNPLQYEKELIDCFRSRKRLRRHRNKPVKIIYL
uniref:FLYWCH-type domain-containing protein n=1 Tax=Rhabditophanes sp. KR3021 TaxID=114890 RepID=A0AC35UET2_9BILA